MIPYTIVLSRWDAQSHLKAALDALSSQEGRRKRFEVLVADAVGDDKTVEQLRDLSPPFPLRHLIVHEHPRTADLRNRALRHVRGRYVAFCSSCWVARPHFLSTLERMHKECPDAVLATDDCLIVPRRALRRVGGFDNAMQGSALGVWELLYRLHQAGYPWLPLEDKVGDRFDCVVPPVEARHLRHLYTKHGGTDVALALMAVIPPWEDAARYRGTLDAYQDCRNGSPSQQAAARALRRACQMAVRAYHG